ncbi:glycosyltransferase family A protein [Thalassotalea ponticola]|uniref:glycosyltransferase family A protein n=1 Tax=Thalassotalea ponticola TaxID=1523392 RepID=UPI0025B3DD4D|nr:glycosyltransferase family A protein [Thalassotalea ponticola]MDN3652655.1 glycosyltransferase family A protein [Thalassotalea ponticola]
MAIPFYNPGPFFIHAINSVLHQTYENLEILLVNDGSTDGSLELALGISDSRVSVISDGINLGLNYRLNQIIDLASGKYLARMDADDLMALNRVERQVNFLKKNPHLDLVTTGLCSIDRSCKVLGLRGPETEGEDKELNLESLLFGYKSPIHASLLAKTSWAKRNKYNETYSRIEDYNLWLTAQKNNDLNIGFLPDYLYFYEESNSIRPELLRLSYINQVRLLLEQFYDDFSFYIKFRFIFKCLIKSLVVSVPFVDTILLRKRNMVEKSAVKALEQEINAILKLAK